jgi:ubiquitin C-terminal hydrolase
MSGGHYTAYAKNNDSWYNFNDSSVHKVGSNEVVSRDAYMLFYRRVDIRRTEV